MVRGGIGSDGVLDVLRLEHIERIAPTCATRATVHDILNGPLGGVLSVKACYQ